MWSFRKVSGGGKDLKEIEYLAFASIWGTLLSALYAELQKQIDVESLHALLSNPLASGIVFACLGLFMGGYAGYAEVKWGMFKKFNQFLKMLQK